MMQSLPGQRGGGADARSTALLCCTAICCALHCTVCCGLPIDQAIHRSPMRPGTKRRRTFSCFKNSRAFLSLNTRHLMRRFVVLIPNMAL